MKDLQTDEKLANAKTSYDDFPYANYSFSYACPEHLYTIAKVFGLKPSSVDTAKVLDMGCGSGGNIMGFAGRYPKSHSIGVDLSKVQIDYGNNIVDKLGLTNIDLKHMSITDIDESFGKFDYIICHGVFSWVPKEVQDKILDISKKLLTPNGIAYVSYNTLPGWNIISTFREMLQFHTDSFARDEDKLVQARAFLQFIQEGLEGSNTPYYKCLKNEVSIINSVDNSYLKHEYLDRGNTQFYFSDFMKMASSHGFNYLADTHLPSMYLGNIPEKARAELQSINDIVRSEQYMDFINNRRFRSTLLCHNNLSLKRNIESDVLEDMWLAMQVVPDVPVEKLDFTNPSLSTSFTINPNTQSGQCTIDNSFISAAFYAFAESSGIYLSMDDIVKYIKAKCPNFSEKNDREAVRLQLLTMLFKGVLTIRAIKPLSASKISEKPAISELALMQLTNNSPIIYNQLNDSINVGALDRIVMLYLDGKSNIDQIVQKVSDMLVHSGNDLQIEGKTVTDKGQRMQLIKDLVNNSLQFCLSYAFLVE
jgi:methyltransferase-like protein/SAM-dependent methyltransferase